MKRMKLTEAVSRTYAPYVKFSRRAERKWLYERAAQTLSAILLSIISRRQIKKEETVS